MHFQTTTILGLAALAAARRSDRFGAKDGGDLAEKSRATAYRINEHGEARIECVELGTLIPKSRTLASGSVSQLSLADHHQVASVEVHTLAPGSEFRSSEGEIAALFSKEPKAALTTIKSGMLEIQSRGFATGSRFDGVGNVDMNADGSQSHIFADINGDDWFYFEDNSSGSDFMATENGDEEVAFKTRSGDVTSLISFFFDEGLEHKKLHDGACNFAGLKTTSDSSFRNSDDAGSRGFLSKQGL